MVLSEAVATRIILFWGGTKSSYGPALKGMIEIDAIIEKIATNK